VNKILVGVVAGCALAALPPVLRPLDVPPAAAATSFVETFDGAPATPQPWRPGNWDVQVHSRDNDTWDQLETIQAQHGPDCGAPPATHPNSSYEGSVFLCRDHVMTAINASGYGVIYLTPNHMVDFSRGESVISFDMSTLRTSARDWVDVWVTPYEDNLALPFEDGVVDLQGPPRRGIHVVMVGENRFEVEVYDNFRPSGLPARGTAYDSVLSPDAARRDRFELRISPTHIRFGMPQYNLWWVDTALPSLGWTTGVVQFGHHSYTPEKDCNSCRANTWHWDNVSISPSTPFTILRADRRNVNAGSPTRTVFFPQPAPPNSYVRFGGIGDNLAVSANGGATWIPAVRQAESRDVDEHFKSFWTPIPAGATSITFRGSGWWGGRWEVRDISIFANNAGVAAGGSYAGLTPARLLDTRPAVRPPGSVTQVQVTGRGGVPGNAAAVSLNLTAVSARAAGFLSVWPCGQIRPVSSTLNYARGQTIANGLISRIGAGGRVCIFTSAGTSILLDVTGYFPPGSSYAGLGPARLLDTRPNGVTADGQFRALGARPAGSILQLQVTGRAGVPTNATAVVLNVASIGARAGGFVTAWPCGLARPGASSLNYAAGQTIANGVISRVGAGGRVCIYTSAVTNVLADITGYFVGAGYTGVSPARLLDTRPGGGGQLGGAGPRPAGSVVQLQVTGRGGVPTNAAAVVLNVASIGARTGGFFTVWPCGSARPAASSLNFGAGQVIANNAISRVGVGGRVCIYTSATTNLIADVNGYFPGVVAAQSLSQASPAVHPRVVTSAPPEASYCELT
jgi:hypothetical protein